MFTPAEWHARFQEQSVWTASARQYVLGKIGAGQAKNILEVGSGTGAVTEALHDLSPAKIYGIDIDPERASFACREDPASLFACADGLHLPFPQGAFDICICHFYLLWVSNPSAAVEEMRRVTRKGGWVTALAEPDYGGRVEYPAEMRALGDLQTHALRKQGANPEIGRRTADLFLQAKLKEVHSGVLGGEWQHPDPQRSGMEWQVLENDLAELVPPEQLARYRQVDERSRRNGERVQFVPTFYAWGKV